MSTNLDVLEVTKLKRPSKWAVICHNDDTTPMDFVIELLYYVFNMQVEPATELMIKIHTEGKGAAGIYSYEIGEQKLAEAMTFVNVGTYNMRITLEEE
jgi:ATP-dependent Clp protease adaptor protein ClpS